MYDDDETLGTIEEPELTAFMKFWEAVNTGLKGNGLPELTFDPAHDLWVLVTNTYRD